MAFLHEMLAPAFDWSDAEERRALADACVLGMGEMWLVQLALQDASGVCPVVRPDAAPN